MTEPIPPRARVIASAALIALLDGDHTAARARVELMPVESLPRIASVAADLALLVHQAARERAS